MMKNSGFLMGFFVLVVALFCGLSPVHAKGQINTILRDGQTTPRFLKEKGVEILEAKKTPGGMTAYIGVKDGSPVVFYVTPDGATALVGVMFDAQTGANLSDQYVARSHQLVSDKRPDFAAMPVENDVARHLMSAAVAGVQEGVASEETAFVFFDPRCPYCHNLFKNTRELAKRGASIKWIPVNALGSAGVPLSAQTLRDGISGMEALSNGRLRASGDASASERSAIDSNTMVLRSIVLPLKMQAATPTIVFKDKNSKLSVLQDDGTNKAALAAAFGKGVTR